PADGRPRRRRRRAGALALRRARLHRRRQWHRSALGDARRLHRPGAGERSGADKRPRGRTGLPGPRGLGGAVRVARRRLGDERQRARALEGRGRRSEGKGVVRRVGGRPARDAPARGAAPGVRLRRPGHVARQPEGAPRPRGPCRRRARAPERLSRDPSESGEVPEGGRSGRESVRGLPHRGRRPAVHRDLRSRPIRRAALHARRWEERSGPPLMEFLGQGLAEAIYRLVTLDADVVEALSASLAVSGTATALSVAIGVPAGTALGLARFRGRGLVLTLVNTGLGLPPVVVGLFVAIFLWRSGPLGDLNLYCTRQAMVIAQLILGAPTVLGLTAIAVQSVDPMLRLQLRALGATPTQALWLFAREARLPILTAAMAGFGAVISEIGAS